MSGLTSDSIKRKRLKILIEITDISLEELKMTIGKNLSNERTSILYKSIHSLKFRKQNKYSFDDIFKDAGLTLHEGRIISSCEFKINGVNIKPLFEEFQKKHSVELIDISWDNFSKELPSDMHTTAAKNAWEWLKNSNNLAWNLCLPKPIGGGINTLQSIYLRELLFKVNGESIDDILNESLGVWLESREMAKELFPKIVLTYNKTQSSKNIKEDIRYLSKIIAISDQELKKTIKSRF